MPCADNNDQHDLIAYKDLKYPVEPELNRSRYIRLEEEPCQRCERHVEDGPRKEVIVEPFQYFHWFWWLGE